MIIWDDEAVEDLQSIYNLIFTKSPQNAEMVVNTIDEIANSLENFPLKFPKEPFINKENIRYVSKWTFKIIYAVLEKDIVILNVFNTNQDPNILIFNDGF